MNCLTEQKKLKNLTEMSLDSQLWHACAGGMVNMPKVNSKVFYFPQGHAEHAQVTITLPKLAPFVPCNVASVKFLADPESDEVYSKLSLIPVSYMEIEFDINEGIELLQESDTVVKPASFAKTLTQSDANNGGGFSVPRYCAETIFPKLDYAADPPVQTVIVKDVHGEIWKFRHIYRGTPRRHLLTTGWSAFVNHKKLIAGDSIVFFRTRLGELCIGIRRAKRGSESAGYQSCWNAGGRGYSVILNNGADGVLRNGSTNIASMKANRTVNVEAVTEAATLAAIGKPFEVVYYPRRASTSEFFCVSVSAVKAAMRIHWCPGMRFKMPFETEDSSRISWFTGTLSSVQVVDPVRWPNSPWRLLQVNWDEPELLPNVNRVNPWLVELVSKSNMPIMNMPSSSPPRKKLCFPLHTDFPRDGQLSMSSLSGNALELRSSIRCLTDNTPLSIQGARHAQFGISELCPKLFTASKTESIENVSCVLSIGISSNHSYEMPKECKKHQHLVLFGQPILTEQEISVLKTPASKTENVHSSVLSDKSSNPGYSTFLETKEQSNGNEICRVYVEGENVGRSIDLSMVHSYKDLYLKLSEMYQIDKLDTLNHVLYHDAATGALKRIGTESFSEFKNSAKKLTVSFDQGKYHESFMGIGIAAAENGLCSSKATGALSIVA